MGIAGMGALALVLATGWVAWGAPPGREVAAPSCAPAEASAFLPINADDALRAHIGDVLQRSAEVESFRFASREEQWERFKVGFSDAPDLVASTRADDLAEAWKFTLRCASDFPAVRERLQGCRRCRGSTCTAPATRAGTPHRLRPAARARHRRAEGYGTRAGSRSRACNGGGDRAGRHLRPRGPIAVKRMQGSSAL
ncbi:permease-like cell division protein FtsX [Dactylosporangium darangshiense]|uniref:permease-like cell division protein FtsX n=1 Tax=Dactylosporangium darangshiense TaxID=579108 RepID=UPI003631E987